MLRLGWLNFVLNTVLSIRLDIRNPADRLPDTQFSVFTGYLVIQQICYPTHSYMK